MLISVIDPADQKLVADTLNVARVWKSLQMIIENLAQQGWLTTQKEVDQADIALTAIFAGQWGPEDEYLAHMVALCASEFSVNIPYVLSHREEVLTKNRQSRTLYEWCGLD